MTSPVAEQPPRLEPGDWFRAAASALVGPVVTLACLWTALGVPRFEGIACSEMLTIAICLFGMVCAELAAPRRDDAVPGPRSIVVALFGVATATVMATPYTQLESLVYHAIPALTFLSGVSGRSRRSRRLAASLGVISGLGMATVPREPPWFAVVGAALAVTFVVERIRGTATPLMRLLAAAAGVVCVYAYVQAAVRGFLPCHDGGPEYPSSHEAGLYLIAATHLWQAIWVLKSPAPPSAPSAPR